ncbi:U32 family peptidase [Clostridium sartagoforme]|uniref:U32 family peptidase n=1 Tax=Clostridium sartagoforme TaxID=84031 RepID=A0A4S2DPP9_9CLOT|nr:U32 family peptidase [Clostridium sartagoforme]TGY44396.1 U32 family peptidase [Clostridium sartagoforme]
MEKIEILAPAGSMESLIASINKGADAVYLGGSKFSARAYASNFDNDNMIKAIDYAHSYGVKVYVTLNTILKENEIEEAVRYVGFLYEVGADAIILQDLGLFKRVREDYPDFEIHASTQMTIHNGEGALFFKEKGFHRIVLSRELSLEEIKYISKELGIETEIFVHGALCISYSGQCLMSSMIGGRSGNRGRCAQPCRMEYTLKGNNSGEKKAYLLSPKDTCTIENIKDIIDSGTYSLKIEGRMKRPEYVAGVVDNYKKAVEKEIYKTDYNVSSGKRELLQLFNRGGFSTAYLKKNLGKDMMSFNHPRNTGVPLGNILKDGEIILKEDIALGDGYRVKDTGFTINKILLKGKEVKEAKRGNKVKIFPINYKVSDEIFKSLDKKLFSSLEDSLKPYNKKILVNAKVKFKVGEALELHINYNDNDYVFKGEIVEKAEKKPLTKERVIEGLLKSQDLAFKINEVEFIDFEDGFIRISDLNNLRREALEGLQKSITKSYRRKRPNKNKIESQDIKSKDNIDMLYQCITKEQLKALIEEGINNIAVDIFNRDRNAVKMQDLIDEANKNNNINFYLKLPNIIKSEFDKVINIIEKLKGSIKGLITVNAGIIRRYQKELFIIGDYKLNIINSEALKFYQNEIDIPTLSLELNRKEIKALLKGNKSNVQGLIYGKTELMISEYCPIGSTFGEKSSNKDCNLACTRDSFTLVDRMKEKFRVMTDIFCRSYIINPYPLNLIDELDDLKSLGINSFRVEFRDESYLEVKKVIKMINKEIEINNSEYTKGHYRRGIE